MGPSAGVKIWRRRILNLGERSVPLRAKQQELSGSKKDHQEIKSWIQKREATPALWRALLGYEVEGGQHIQVLTPPSALRGAAWAQSAPEKREFVAACMD